MLLKAGAGTSLARVCLIALKNGLKGLEGFMGIPGSMGGCLTMNAGTGSSSIGESVNTVEMLTEDGKSISLHRSDITFGYRCATYPSQGVIVEAGLMVKRNGGGELRKLALEAARRRTAAKKVFPFNAGSIFKNPPGHSAGALIEECGLKGANEGDAQISHLHGNIIVNRGNAKAEDILKLMDRARATVLSRLSIELEHEIRIIGE